MSENALIPVDFVGGELAVQQDTDLLTEVAKGGAFLPYLQLFTTKSDPVTEGKIPGGHYGLVRDGNITDLGKEIIAVVITVRARAFEKGDDGQVTVIFDKNDAEYQRIQALQAENVVGCMAGPEFLFWLPNEQTFATFFCGSKTLKRESRKFSPFIAGKTMQERVAQLRVHLIDNSKYKWHGPVVNTCSSTPSCLPDKEDLDEQVKKFKNPPKQKPGEKAEVNATDNVAR